MPIQHFKNAIDHFLEVNRTPLSLGEVEVLQQWPLFSESAQQLYCWLFHRKPKYFQRNNIHYVDTDNSFWFDTSLEEERALTELTSSGFGSYVHEHLDNSLYLGLLTRNQLNKLCKVYLVSDKGNKNDCIERLTHLTVSRVVPIFFVSHRILFSQICRQYVLSHQGNLHRLALSEYETVPIEYFPYTVTMGRPLHPMRRDAVLYREWYGICKNNTTPQCIQPPTIYFLSTLQFRFSGLRFWIVYLLDTVPTPMTKHYIDQIKTILPYAQTHSLDVLLRLALSLLKMNRGTEGLQILLKAFRTETSLLHKIRIAQTGRHLARRLKRSFPPLIPLQSATDRTLRWTTVKCGSRQTYNGIVIELAVLKHLESHGRTVLRTENAPWNALFSLLLLDVLFSDEPYQLPSPILSAPLDFGTVEFYERRIENITKRIHDLRIHGVSQILVEQTAVLLHPVEHYKIRGCNWSQYTFDDLLDFSSLIPTQIVIDIIEHKLKHPDQAHRGLPDLCVLTGESVRIKELFPSKIPSDFFFLEVKSEQDTISPYQKHWIHILKTSDALVEVWNIKA
jgi:hypothetical protein